MLCCLVITLVSSTHHIYYLAATRPGEWDWSMALGELLDNALLVIFYLKQEKSQGANNTRRIVYL